MPVTMAAFFVGALSVIGLPPCGGFISKWLLVVGTVESQRWDMLAVLLISSLLSAAYFLPVVYKAFFCTREESLFKDEIAEAPVWCIVPPVLTALFSVWFFFYPEPFLMLADSAVNAFTGSGGR